MPLNPAQRQRHTPESLPGKGFAGQTFFIIFAVGRHCHAHKSDKTMLKRDYIMRLIREFAEALELMLKKDTARQREEIKTMYDQYVGPYAFYRTATMDEVMETFARHPKEERAERMEMLAELYYTEAGLTPGPERGEMLRRALAMFDFIDRHCRTYSFDRMAKIADIKKRLAAAARSGQPPCGDGTRQPTTTPETPAGINASADESRHEPPQTEPHIKETEV